MCLEVLLSIAGVLLNMPGLGLKVSKFEVLRKPKS